MRLVCTLAALSLIAVGCGPTDENGDGIADGVRTPDSVTQVAPSTPVGTISGTVLTSRFTPLQGADVIINVGAINGEQTTQQTTTDSNGFYFFKGVPAANQVLVTMSKAGFGTGRTQVIVPATAGNIPINNGNANAAPFILTELNGAVKFIVVSHTGRPAKGARATLEAFPAAMEVSSFTSGYGSPRGTTVVDGTVGDDGTLSFVGIPTPEEMARLQGRYTLHINAYDENNDNVIDSAGWNASYDGQQLVEDSAPRVIVLPQARDTGRGLIILSSNVPSLIGSSMAPSDNMLRPGDPIFIAFSEAIIPSSVQVKLTDETGTQSLQQSASVGASAATLNIQPAAALEPGKRYNLSVRVVSADSGAELSAEGFFFGGDPSAPKAFDVTSITFEDSTPDNTLTSGEQLYVTFNQPVGSHYSGSSNVPPVMFLFVNQDLGTPTSGTPGTVGDYPGELNYRGFQNPPSPFQLTIEEPPPGPVGLPVLIPILQANYSTVWGMRVPPTGGTAVYSFPVGTQMQIQFSLPSSTGVGFDTIWNQPITQDETASLTKAP